MTIKKSNNSLLLIVIETVINGKNSYFYIEKRTFKVMCEVYYREKRDKKEAK